MKTKSYKTVYYFDLYVDCVCRGIKDTKGDPVKYASPLGINDFLRSFADLNAAFSLNAPLQEDSDVEGNVEEEANEYDDLIGQPKEVESVELGEPLEQDDEGEDSDVEHDRPSRKYNSGRLDVYLQDIKEFDQYFVLLVNFTDLTSSHGVIRDIESGARTESNLATSEGADLSSHIVIFKVPDQSSRQLCLIEKTYGLTNSVIKSFLDFLGKLVVESRGDEFKINDPKGGVDRKGKPKVRTIWPRFYLHGYPSDAFFEDIQNGYLKRLALVGEAKNLKGMDAELPPEFDEITIKIDANLAKGESVKDRIKRLMDHGKTYNLDRVRISFDDASGAPHTREIDIDARIDDDNLDYVKKKRISMGFRPMSSYHSVKMSLVHKMTGTRDDE